MHCLFHDLCQPSKCEKHINNFTFIFTRLTKAVKKYSSRNALGWIDILLSTSIFFFCYHVSPPSVVKIPYNGLKLIVFFVLFLGSTSNNKCTNFLLTYIF